MGANTVELLWLPDPAVKRRDGWIPNREMLGVAIAFRNAVSPYVENRRLGLQSLAGRFGLPRGSASRTKTEECQKQRDQDVKNQEFILSRV